ncbi:MAG: zinc-dependent metalloprotease family protein, partial [Planctomycetota bacterium]
MRANRKAKRVRKQQEAYFYFEVENLETRLVLSATFPAYVDGAFTFGDASLDAPYGLENTFDLESLPGAEKTIYLDFDGHRSVNNEWGHDITFPAFDRNGDTNSFSDAELIEIQKQFQNVAEDFLPFNVNVTTTDPGVEALRRTNFNDSEYGIRVLNTQPTEGFGDGIGGIAYLTSFRYSTDTPVFTFNKGVNNGAMTNSHEIGHALGLSHDGLGGSTYHPGNGDYGQTGWGPIMGAPFYHNVTQWSNGDYSNSTSTQNDLAIIAGSSNGFGYRADDHGNSIANSTALSTLGATVSGWGIIERTSDEDFLSFTTGAGQVDLTINAFGENANLDILARLYDDAGNEIASSNPVNQLGASFSESLAAGTYHISVDGTGKAGVYSDYGSLGLFQVSGTIVAVENNIGEAGTVAGLTKSWRTVTLENNYVDPVVVAGPATANEADPTTVRVRNVTSNSFQIQLDEWNYLDGVSGGEDIDYIVMEAGVNTLTDGTVVVASNVDGINHKWQEVEFGYTFDDTPIVVSQTVTRNGGSAVTTRHRLPDESGFTVKVQEEEAGGGHQAETVAWIAIESGVGTTGDLN